MTYKYEPKSGLEPIAGLPLEAADADFEAAVKRVEGARALDAIKASGIYKYVDDAKKKEA